MLRIAIIGGAGLIGAQLSRAYLDAGHDVLVIDTAPAAARASTDGGARFYQIDVRDAKLRHIFQQERPDIVSYHVAQRLQPDVPFGEQPVDDADLHIRGLLNTLESCVAAQVGTILFASGGNDLYCGLCPAGMGTTRFKEDAPLRPHKPRDISKVAGEWYVRYYTRQYGLAHTILRYADVYGEAVSGSQPHPLNDIILALQQGQRPIFRQPVDEIRDHIYLGDVVAANLRVLDRGRNQTLHISSGEGYTLRALYDLVAAQLQCECEPLSLSRPLDEPSSMILDNTLARRVLGWQPAVSLAEGVRRVAEYIGGQRVIKQVEEPVLAGVR